MDAFAGAVKAGAHAIETDIHLSKDGVVVLSHVSRGYQQNENSALTSISNRMQRSNGVLAKIKK